MARLVFGQVAVLPARAVANPRLAAKKAEIGCKKNEIGCKKLPIKETRLVQKKAEQEEWLIVQIEGVVVT